MCQKCLREAHHVHHRVLRGMGGTSDSYILYDLANLVSLCHDCHTYIHGHPSEAYEEGWIVHSWDDPADVVWKNPEVPKF